MEKPKEKWNSDALVLFAGMLFCLFLGVWFGKIIDQMFIYNSCSASGKVTFSSVLYLQDITFNCGPMPKK
jgi:zona occludens toxin (predicted ATPase)